MTEQHQPHQPQKSGGKVSIIGIILIILGILILLSNFGVISFQGFWNYFWLIFWPVVLVLLGIYFIKKKDDK